MRKSVGATARAVLLSGLLAAPGARAADGIDVVTQLPSQQAKTTVAKVRPDVTSCLSLLQDGSWFALTPRDVIWYVDEANNAAWEINRDAIEQWKAARTSDIGEASDVVAKYRANPSMPADVKDALTKYPDPVGTGIPTIDPIKLTVTPAPGAKPVAELRALNRRLERLRNELRQVPAIALAAEQFACAYQLNELPAKLTAPELTTPASLEAVKVIGVGPSWQPRSRRMATGEDLSRLFGARK